MDGIQSTLNVLGGHFVSNDAEYQKYIQMDILKPSENRSIQRAEGFAKKLNEKEFHKELKDIISVGLQRYKDKYIQNNNQDVPFVLYEKYSRRDVSFLMDCGKDLSSTMYGMKKINDDVFYFLLHIIKEKNRKTMVKNISMENLIMQMCLKTIKYSVGILRLEEVLIVLIRKM